MNKGSAGIIQGYVLLETHIREQSIKSLFRIQLNLKGMHAERDKWIQGC